MIIFLNWPHTEAEKKQATVPTSPSATTTQPRPAEDEKKQAAVPTSPSATTTQPQLTPKVVAWADSIKDAKIDEVAPHFFVISMCSGCDPAGFYCKQPIRSASDLKGKKVRVSVNDGDLKERVTSAGAILVSLSFAEIYRALIAGVIDCVGGTQAPPRPSSSSPR